MSLTSITTSLRHASGIQLAVDGSWESAWLLRHGNTIPSVDDIAAWLPDTPHNVAFEVFFPQYPSGEAFLGIRLTGSQRLAQAQILYTIIQAVLRRTWTTFDTLMENIQTVLPAFATVPALTASPDALDIGVVNAWRSIGPCRIWKRDEPDISTEQLQERLSRHPVLLHPQPKPLALEVAFCQPLEHWLGLEVSVVQGSDHILDLARVIQFAQIIQTSNE